MVWPFFDQKLRLKGCNGEDFDIQHVFQVLCSIFRRVRQANTPIEQTISCRIHRQIEERIPQNYRLWFNQQAAYYLNRVRAGAGFQVCRFNQQALGLNSRRFRLLFKTRCNKQALLLLLILAEEQTTFCPARECTRYWVNHLGYVHW